MSLHWSLKKAFLSLFAILWNSAFRWIYLSFTPLPLASLLSSVIYKVFSDNHFVFLHFFFLGIILITASCTMSIVLQALSLSDLTLLTYFSPPLYSNKGFNLGHTWMAYSFPYFPQFKSVCGNKEFTTWATVSSWSCFCWLYRASPSLPVKNITSLILLLTIWWCPHVFSCAVGRGSLLWPVRSLGKTLLAFALLHFVLQGQICLLLQVFLYFLLLHSSPL